MLANHFDRYPNFAVDLAGRMPYFALQHRDQAIAFILKYQDRLIYESDMESHNSENVSGRDRFWEETYAREWRFLILFCVRSITITLSAGFPASFLRAKLQLDLSPGSAGNGQYRARCIGNNIECTRQSRLQPQM